jgi:hypothetical protein
MEEKTYNFQVTKIENSYWISKKEWKKMVRFLKALGVRVEVEDGK